MGNLQIICSPSQCLVGALKAWSQLFDIPPCLWFYRHRTSRFCVMLSLHLVKPPSNRRSSIQTPLFSWRCSWPTTDCTRSKHWLNAHCYYCSQWNTWPWTCLLPSFRPGSCYETAMTRKFYHGRTETMRPCTQEAVTWCEAMMDPTCNVSVVGKITGKKVKCSRIRAKLSLSQDNARRKAMMQAFGKHNKLMSEAQEGQG